MCYRGLCDFCKIIQHTTLSVVSHIERIGYQPYWLLLLLLLLIHTFSVLSNKANVTRERDDTAKKTPGLVSVGLQMLQQQQQRVYYNTDCMPIMRRLPHDV